MFGKDGNPESTRKPTDQRSFFLSIVNNEQCIAENEQCFAAGGTITTVISQCGVLKDYFEKFEYFNPCIWDKFNFV